jgi:hypothetical protein
MGRTSSPCNGHPLVVDSPPVDAKFAPSTTRGVLCLSNWNLIIIINHSFVVCYFYMMGLGRAGKHVIYS